MEKNEQNKIIFTHPENKTLLGGKTLVKNVTSLENCQSQCIKKPLKKRKKWFTFSWYNQRKVDRKYGVECSDEEQKIVVHWNWHVPFIPFEGIEFAKGYKWSQLVFCGTENLYWFFVKHRCDEKYRWFFKTSNDHTACG